MTLLIVHFVDDIGNSYEHHDPYNPISPNNFNVRMNNYTTEDHDAENMTPAVRDNVNEFSEEEEVDDNNDASTGNLII